MLDCFYTKQEQDHIIIELIVEANFSVWLAKQSTQEQAWLISTGFKAEPGSFRSLPDATGRFKRVVFAMRSLDSVWEVGSLPYLLPEGYYALQSSSFNQLHALAWGLGAYQFTRYKSAKRMAAKLFLPADQQDFVCRHVEAIYYVRDLINTPAEDMGPTELAHQVQALAQNYQAEYRQVVGEALLQENYPCIYAVGRASDDAPRLLDLRWGDESHPKVTLVGKGVCFDTGGLDLKPSPYMSLMKKDMGGAAHVLGLAQLIMAYQLPVRLRVLIPAVENSVSGSAYRPGDVLTTRKGLTVEVGNTDAEGRLVLADALTEAVAESPDLLIDIATLTGAARVAMGPDLPALFTNQDELANQMMQHGKLISDPVWHMPLFTGYRDYLDSSIADLNNQAAEPYAGAITAALFLQAFVPDMTPWLHFDVMAWNIRPRPGKPKGGEAMGIRALFSYLCARYL